MDDYLAGPIGELDLPGYHLNLWTQPDQHRTAAATFTENITGLISPVPGVTLTESHPIPGTRAYTVRRDDLEERPGAWAVSVNGTTIDLYVNGTEMAARYTVRIIREAMLRTYENTAGVVFHAAGIDRAESAVMICGPRSAGKTTTLAALLRAVGDDGALLSNDRVIVHGDHRVVAVPLPVPLARGTIDAFPELRSVIPAPAHADLPVSFATTTKTTLAARPFAAAFGSSLAAGSHLRALLAPRFSDTAQPPRVRRLTESEVLALLQKKAPGRYVFDRPDHADFTIGGHYEAGETIPEGVREVREELGLDVPYTDLQYLGIRQTAVTLAPGWMEREFQYWHLLPLGLDLEQVPLDDAEVSGLVELDLAAAIDLTDGTRTDVPVRYLIRDGANRRYADGTLSRSDLIPGYLDENTDRLYLRLFIAARRYTAGERTHLFW